MDEQNRRRPGQNIHNPAAGERPRTSRGPQPPRRQSGTASEQAQARRERLAAREQAEAPARAESWRSAQTAGTERRPRAEERPVRRTREASGQETQPRGQTQRRRSQETRDTDRRRAPEPETRRRTAREPDSNAEAPAAGRQTPRKKKAKKPHRVYSTNFGFKFLTMLAVVGVIVLAMMIFFKVKHIGVQNYGTAGRAAADTAAAAEENTAVTGVSVEAEGGLSYYSAQQIIDASGISIDDNLLSLSKAGVASRIHAALPYINEVQIRKKLPGTVIISVSEFTVTYGIQDEHGAWWLISREGRVLEPTDEQGVKSHLTVTGMPIETPQVGDYIKPVAAYGADLSEIAAKRTATVTVLPLLEQSPFAEQIVSLDVSTSYDIRIWYGTQFEVKLGNTENLAYKLNYLQAVIKELGKDKSGTIDLTFTEDDGAHFLPFG